MTLRRQLLLVSLLLLSLPWAGCQFIREMEGAMRLGQDNALLATARAIATVAQTQANPLFGTSTHPTNTPGDAEALYAFPSDEPVIVDGYGDGWEDIPGLFFTGKTDSGLHLKASARTRDSRLYLLLKVADDNVQYYNPGLPERHEGDRLLLRLGTERIPRDYVIATAAPGQVRAKPASRSARSDEAASIRGHWQDATGGYTLELAMPLALSAGHLGLAVIDAGHATGSHAGNIDPNVALSAPRLITSPPEARWLLAPFTESGRQLLLVDSQDWVLADSSAPEIATRGQGETFWLLQLLYRSILTQDRLAKPPRPARPGKISGREIDDALAGKASSQRYRDPHSSSRTVQSSAAPVIIDEQVVGAIVIRESGETYLSLTDHAFSRLLGYSLIAMAAAALGMLGYASVLSWRIRRLSNAVNCAIAEDGAVLDDFSGSKAKDEVGDLSRHYATLLRRVREYNDYLRSLSRKLSHELRTPIAVIQSSLDNLDNSADDVATSIRYRQRAREGLNRLQRILAAMSEATRLEESIHADALVATDLAPVLSSVWASYADIYTAHTLCSDIQVDRALAHASPDLLVQALDKIIDNAVSFCPRGGRIKLSLQALRNNWKISIDNDGPILPDDQLTQLFEPMVSRREPDNEQVHLGLGLHIVRLVMDFHRGTVAAENRADGSGVIISLEIPQAN